MAPEEILAYESRRRIPTVAIAAFAGIALMVAAELQLTGPRPKVSELTLGLLVAHKRGSRDLIAAIINALAALAVAWTLLQLLWSARARSPDGVRPYIRIIVIAAALVSAVAGVAYGIVFMAKAQQFATTGSQTYDEASRLTSGGGLLALQVLGLVGALLSAFAFVLVSLQAMQHGLLSKFMGYLGMFAGALFLFQIIQVPIFQFYWLLAVGFLMSGRWPNGVPPAWSSGRSEPWPSSADMRNRRAAAARARNSGRGAPAAAGAGAGSGSAGEREANGEPAEGRTRATTPKRKRKRRN